MMGQSLMHPPSVRATGHLGSVFLPMDVSCAKLQVDRNCSSCWVWIPLDTWRTYKTARPSVSGGRKCTVGLDGPNETASPALACNDAETGPHSIEEWEHQRH